MASGRTTNCARQVQAWELGDRVRPGQWYHSSIVVAGAGAVGTLLTVHCTPLPLPFAICHLPSACCSPPQPPQPALFGVHDVRFFSTFYTRAPGRPPQGLRATSDKRRRQGDKATRRGRKLVGRFLGAGAGALCLSFGGCAPVMESGALGHLSCTGKGNWATGKGLPAPLLASAGLGQRGGFRFWEMNWTGDRLNATQRNERNATNATQQHVCHHRIVPDAADASGSR
jgi:hypothetical protein